jgi:hypothetical protein
MQSASCPVHCPGRGERFIGCVFREKPAPESFPTARVLAKGIQDLPGDRSEFWWINARGPHRRSWRKLL